MRSARQLQELVSGRFRIPAPTLLAGAGRSSMSFSRLACNDFSHGCSGPVEAEDAFVLHLHLRETDDHELHLKGRRMGAGRARKGAVFLSSLENQPIVDFQSPFDFLRIYLSRTAIDDAMGRRPGGGFRGLRLGQQGQPDPLMLDVAAGLLPLFDLSGGAGQLFLDSIALALLDYILQAYGGEPVLLRQQKGGLAPWQEKRAKDYMDANVAADLTLADIARQCELSPSHFGKAFRITTGRPPHKWLLERRVERAKQHLVHSPESLAEVARLCGFSGACHLSRAFSQFTGEAPASWRRRNRG
jgi:AraC family transcriptional regulator